LVPLGVTVFATNSALWNRETWYLLSALVAVGLFGLWLYGGRILEWRRTSIHPGRYITTMYLLEMGFDLVAFQWLWDLTDVSATHHHRNGVYTHSTVSLQFPTGRRQLTIKGQERTVALLRFMNEAQRVVRTAEARDDHTTLSTLDDLKGIKRGTKGTRRPWHSSPLALCVAACPAFRAVIPGDVLDLRLTQGRGAAQGGPRSTGLRPDVEVHPGSTGAIGAITVSYRVIPSDSLYYRDSDEQTPAKSRPFYPGIVFDWDCHVSVGHLEHGRPSESASTLRVGDEATSPYAGLDLGQPPGSPGVSDEATDPYAGIDFGQPSGSLGGNARAPDTYVFQLQSKPADKFRETGAGVYEDMTESAFVDFRQELVRRLGIAVKLPSNPFDAIDWSAPAERGAAGGPLK
jgi:hypothetical protein